MGFFLSNEPQWLNERGWMDAGSDQSHMKYFVTVSRYFSPNYFTRRIPVTPQDV